MAAFRQLECPHGHVVERRKCWDRQSRGETIVAGAPFATDASWIDGSSQGGAFIRSDDDPGSLYAMSGVLTAVLEPTAFVYISLVGLGVLAWKRLAWHQTPE